MPYITRNASGDIARVSSRPLPDSKFVQADFPELLNFLRTKGQDPDAVLHAFHELSRTDADMSRAVEDVVMALLKKNLLKMSELPKPVQEKMGTRVRLRVLIQEAYDRASDQPLSPHIPSNADFI